MSYKELFSIIADQLDKPEPKIAAGKWMGEVYWRLQRVKSGLTGKKPLVTKETAQTANNNYRYSSSKIESRLNSNFIPIKDSIRDACAFHMRSKEINELM